MSSELYQNVLSNFDESKIKMIGCYMTGVGEGAGKVAPFELMRAENEV